MLERVSITLRLSLLFALVSMLTLAGVGTYLYRSLERQFASRDTAELAGKVELVRYILSAVPASDAIPDRQQDFAHVVVGHAGLYLAVFDARREVLYASSSLRLPDAVLQSAFDAAEVPDATEIWRPGPAVRFRALSAWADLAPGSGHRVLIALALDTTEQEALLATYRQHLFVALLSGGLLVALLGFGVARQGLRPVRRMADTAYRISADRLSARLDARQVPSELEQLATAFNAMLARLEDSFTRLAAFSSDLAHELRTPVHNLMGQTQVALSRPRSVEEYRGVLESNLEECERLSRMIADMLFLAKADHAQLALKAEAVDLRAELDKVVEFYQAHAEERELRVVCEGTGSVLADRALVRRAIGNLLSNALKHTPEGGEIRARLSAESGALTLVVSNPGPGIPAPHLARVFDRFYRIDSARGSAEEGSGLGLAIVKSIMELHGGSVHVSSEPGQLTSFTLVFPKDHDGPGAPNAPASGSRVPEPQLTNL